MPIPEPSSGQSENEYISECIGKLISEGKPQDQAAAICYETWRNNMNAKVKTFTIKKFAETYSDYPKQATENAKIALRWAEENGWGDCGTPVGKKRANDLASNRPLSRDTIARMAGFERHRQNSQKELGDGCGRLMWLAWGGDAGIEWAQRKLKQIENEK
jgi:hypothetical protein